MAHATIAEAVAAGAGVNGGEGVAAGLDGVGVGAGVDGGGGAGLGVVEDTMEHMGNEFR